MENNEASVYDINDLSPTEILNEGDDRSNTNMNNYKFNNTTQDDQVLHFTATGNTITLSSSYHHQLIIIISSSS